MLDPTRDLQTLYKVERKRLACTETMGKRDKSPQRKNAYREKMSVFSDLEVAECEKALSGLYEQVRYNNSLLDEMTTNCLELKEIRPYDSFQSGPVSLIWRLINWRKCPEITELLLDRSTIPLLLETHPKYCIAQVQGLAKVQQELTTFLNEIHTLYLKFFRKFGHHNFYPWQVNSPFPFQRRDGRCVIGYETQMLFAPSKYVLEVPELYRAALIDAVRESLEFVSRFAHESVVSWTITDDWLRELQCEWFTRERLVQFIVIFFNLALGCDTPILEALYLDWWTGYKVVYPTEANWTHLEPTDIYGHSGQKIYLSPNGRVWQFGSWHHHIDAETPEIENQYWKLPLSLEPGNHIEELPEEDYENWQRIQILDPSVFKATN